MIITKNAIVTDNPFIGTTITIEVPQNAEARRFGIYTLTPASESIASIEWGDGSVMQVETQMQNIVHEYPASGVYQIRISDDVSTLGVSTDADSQEVYTETYAPMIQAACSNATRLTSLAGGCFKGAVNMTKFDFMATPVKSMTHMVLHGCSSLKSLAKLPMSVETLVYYAFTNCSGATRRVNLPNVTHFTRCTGAGQPFAGCSGIEEIHFGAANEEIIKASATYADNPTFGAPNAQVYFDL